MFATMELAMGAVVTDDLIGRLRQIEVSTLCDGDKTIPIVDPGVRALVRDVRMVGVARTLVAEDDHLPVFAALAASTPGDVLVIATNGHQRAVLGEIVVTEAIRRGIAGIVIDGYCRDLQGIRALGLPLFARGTIRRPVRPCRAAPSTSASSAAVSRSRPATSCSATTTASRSRRPSASPPRSRWRRRRARAEQAVLAGIRAGTSLHDLTNYADHVALLEQGRRARWSSGSMSTQAEGWAHAFARGRTTAAPR